METATTCPGIAKQQPCWSKMDDGFVGESDAYKACEGQMRPMWVVLSHLNANIDLDGITFAISLMNLSAGSFLQRENPEFNGGNLGPSG